MEGIDYEIEYGDIMSNGRKISVKIKGKHEQGSSIGNFTGEVEKKVKTS